jgi:hypothetical protein
VTFVSGIIYEYKSVPEKIYESMRNSFSKGRFLNEHVKGKFSFEKIKEGGQHGSL